MRYQIPAIFWICAALLSPSLSFAQETTEQAVVNDTEISPEGLKAAFEQQQWDKALEISSKLLESAPDDLNYLSIQGIAYAQKDQNEAAEQVFLKIDKLSPDDPQNAGNLCYAQHNLARRNALDTCLRAAKLNPDKAAINFMAGQMLENANRLDEAEKAYETAVNLEPDNIQYLTSLTNINYMQQNYRKMADNTEAALKRGMESPILYLNLLSALKLLGEYEKAIEWADRGIEKYHDPGIVLSKGEALYRLNRIEEAGKLLRDANKAIDKKSVLWPRSTYYLARVMLIEPCSQAENGVCDTSEDACCIKAQEATTLLESIGNLSSLLNDSNYDVFTGLAQMLSGDLEKAEATLSKAVHNNMNQDNASALAALAVTLYQFNDPKDKTAALQYYRQALDASVDFSDMQKIRNTRQWPDKAVEILSQIKAESEKPAKSKSGCGCEIAVPDSGNTIPMAGLLGMLFALAGMLGLRRRHLS